MAIGDEILLERVSQREAQMHQLADALDVKQSILLVAITFLAGQSTFFLTNHKAGVLHWEQVFACLIEITAGCVIAWLLRIQNHPSEASESYPAWRDDLLASHEIAVPDALRKGIIEGCCERIAKTRKINDRKCVGLKWAYSLTLIALAANMLALISLSF